MTDKISVRQICIIMCCFGAALKLMLYPTTMAAACGNALWLPVLADTAIETLCVWAVAFLCSRTDKTLFQLIEGVAGRWAARAVYALFALFFVANVFVPMSEQQLMVHEVFYDTIPSLLVFLPFFFFAVYAGTKRLTNAGRTADICLPVFAITLAILIAMSLFECDFSNLLPFLKQPVSTLYSGCASGFFRFTQGAYLLMFMGHFDYKKGDCAKITLSCAAGGLIVAFVAAVFYAVYGNLAEVQYFAVTKISIFFSAIALIGRTDLFAVYALDIVMLFALALNIQLACHCLEKAVGKPLRPVYSLAVNAVLITLIFLFNNKFSLVQTIGSDWLVYAALIFAYVLPAAAWVFYALNKRRGGGQ